MQRLVAAVVLLLLLASLPRCLSEEAWNLRGVPEGGVPVVPAWGPAAAWGVPSWGDAPWGDGALAAVPPRTLLGFARPALALAPVSGVPGPATTEHLPAVAVPYLTSPSSPLGPPQRTPLGPLQGPPQGLLPPGLTPLTSSTSQPVHITNAPQREAKSIGMSPISLAVSPSDTTDSSFAPHSTASSLPTAGVVEIVEEVEIKERKNSSRHDLVEHDVLTEVGAASKASPPHWTVTVTADDAATAVSTDAASPDDGVVHGSGEMANDEPARPAESTAAPSPSVAPQEAATSQEPGPASSSAPASTPATSPTPSTPQALPLSTVAATEGLTTEPISVVHPAVVTNGSILAAKKKDVLSGPRAHQPAPTPASSAPVSPGAPLAPKLHRAGVGAAVSGDGGAGGGLDAGTITGIVLGLVVFAALVGTVSFVLYRRRYLNKPQTLNDKCSNPDSSGYIDDSTLRENSEEMYSLDNDSFLNSLEAMTIQNYWTDSVKHTKL